MLSFVVGHISPEAQDGGPIGLLRDGDVVTVDVDRKLINADLSDEQWAQRAKEFVPKPPAATSGTLYKYMRLVQGAEFGCVTDAYTEE